MYDLQYFFAKLRFKIRNEDTEVISDFFRKYGMKVGTGCKIYSNLLTPESYLVTIGDNVSISNDVQIITHDNSISKVYPEYTDVFFRVTIGNNCFIGARATIMGGVTLANNVIVAAGSVVTKSFREENIIIAGNPARKIGNWDDFGTKYSPFGLNIEGMTSEQKKEYILNSKKIIEKE